jgi:hypothetical protein
VIGVVDFGLGDYGLAELQPKRNIVIEENSDNPFAYVILIRVYEEKET